MNFILENRRFVKWGALALVLLVIALRSFTIVGTGYVGVVNCFGTVQDPPLTQGLSPKAFWCSVDEMHAQLKPYKAEAHGASRDMQKVTIKVTVPYSLEESMSSKFFVAIGEEDDFINTILIPGIQEEAKAASATFTGEDLITKRENLRAAFDTRLHTFVAAVLEKKGVPGGVSIGHVTIDDVDFTSPKFKAAIDAKVTAGQRAEQAKNEGKKIVTEAEGIASEIRNAADGEAYKLRTDAEQEAAAIEREGEALKSNPELVKLTAIANWKKRLPRVVGQTLPMMSVAPAAPQPAAQ